MTPSPTRKHHGEPHRRSWPWPALLVTHRCIRNLELSICISMWCPFTDILYLRSQVIYHHFTGLLKFSRPEQLRNKWGGRWQQWKDPFVSKSAEPTSRITEQKHSDL